MLNLTNGQKVLLNGSAMLGSNAGTANFDFDIGYIFGANPLAAVSGLSYQSAIVPINTRPCFSTSPIFTASAAGRYNFVFAVKNTGSPALNINDFSTLTAVVFN